jgi:hypothetical protein
MINSAFILYYFTFFFKLNPVFKITEGLQRRLQIAFKCGNIRLGELIWNKCLGIIGTTWTLLAFFLPLFFKNPHIKDNIKLSFAISSAILVGIILLAYVCIFIYNLRKFKFKSY